LYSTASAVKVNYPAHRRKNFTKGLQEMLVQCKGREEIKVVWKKEEKGSGGGERSGNGGIRVFRI